MENDISNPTQVNLAINFFVLCANKKVYLHNGRALQKSFEHKINMTFSLLTLKNALILTYLFSMERSHRHVSPLQNVKSVT